MKKTSETVAGLLPLRALIERVEAAAQTERPYVITVDFLAALLDGYLQGVLSPSELLAYAEYLDVNDDMDFEEYEASPEVVFQMTSPEINGLMTPQRAVHLLGRLRTVSLGAAKPHSPTGPL